MEDNVPQMHFQIPVLHWVQDIIAPFYVFSKAKFEGESKVYNANDTTYEMYLQSTLSTYFMGFKGTSRCYETYFGKQGLKKMVFQNKGLKEEWLCVN